LTANITPILTLPALNADGYIGGFFSRLGGVSRGEFESLNLSLSQGDEPQHVEENRRRVLEKIHVRTIAVAKQVHGTHPLFLREAPHPGFVHLGEADAVYSDLPGVAVGVSTADCAPILLWSVEKPGYASIHAGWRGAFKNIIHHVMTAFCHDLGIKAEHLKAEIGPAIGRCCYEVSPELAEQFLRAYLNIENLVEPSLKGTPHLNLPLLVNHQLIEAGLARSSIHNQNICTCCNRDYFSYRRQGRSGRQLSCVGIEVR